MCSQSLEKYKWGTYALKKTDNRQSKTNSGISKALKTFRYLKLARILVVKIICL